MTTFRTEHDPLGSAATCRSGRRLDCGRGPRDRTNVVDPVAQGGSLGREHATAQFTPLPLAPALLAGG